MIKSISRNLKLSKSPRHNEQILALAMRQIEKMLQEMQNEGKDLSGLKLKKFQKTHHIDCRCGMCAASAPTSTLLTGWSSTEVSGET